MATDRQIAANRRNAGQSTGPCSSAGKTRASQNSYRHGLSAAFTLGKKYDELVTSLACQIAGEGSTPTISHHARMAAEAQLDLARARRAKVATIQRITAFGEPGQQRSVSLRRLRNWQEVLASGDDLMSIQIPEPASRMPDSEPERSTEAIRRALPELLKLERYERRAASRRERALRVVCNAQNSAINR